jgi:hypothetical protein
VVSRDPNGDLNGGPLASVVETLLPPHSTHRHDAGCRGAGVDRVGSALVGVNRASRYTIRGEVNAMTFFNTTMVLAAMVGGSLLGFFTALKIGNDKRGYDTGVYLGGMASLLGGLMLGELFGGWGENAVGGMVGIPSGVFLGCMIGVAFLSITFGVVSRLVSRFLNE